MRPHHWVKNILVMAPILFSNNFGSLWAWERTIAVAVAFCLLSSSIYLINDIADREADRAHPVKRNRPIASGRLGIGVAVSWSIVLMVLGLGLAVAVEILTYNPAHPLHGLQLVVWTLAYVVLNLLYSFWLKHHVIVDVIAVAMGFVLRAMAGAAAIAVPISPWLVVCTFTLCLFIALTKRRGEIITLNEQAGAARAANRQYDLADLEHMVTVSTSMALLTYSLYCLSIMTINRIHSAHMIWTIPLVVYGMFRYSQLTRKAGKSDAVLVLIHDKVLWCVVAAYVVLVILVLKYGPAVGSILETR